MADIERIADKVDGVKHTVAIAGQSLLLAANASNFGALYVMLDDFEHRDCIGDVSAIVGWGPPPPGSSRANRAAWQRM